MLMPQTTEKQGVTKSNVEAYALQFPHLCNEVIATELQASQELR